MATDPAPIGQRCGETGRNDHTGEAVHCDLPEDHPGPHEQYGDGPHGRGPGRYVWGDWTGGIKR